MPSEISRKIQNLMAAEMGPIGKFIIKKQCEKIGVDSDNITADDINQLTNALIEAIVMFTGQEKANKIKKELVKLSEG